MDDLPLERLFAAAGAARERAYAPYSRFKVGAAILDERGEVHAGANVESVAYPQSQCAEASALGVMVAAGGRRVRAVLILAESSAPCAPCGGCRQRLAEFAAADAPILLAGPEGVRLRVTLGELLPMAFAAGEVGQAR